MQREYVVASQIQWFLRENEQDYDLAFVEGQIDDEIVTNTVVWCCGLQKILPWFANPLEKEYQDAMRWRYAHRLRASMIFLSIFFMTFVAYEYVHGTDRFYVSGFARMVCAFTSLLLALAARSVIHGGFLSVGWRYQLFSSFVIFFATGSTMALSVVDQDMRPPVDLVIVMTGMYGIAAAPFVRLSAIMVASTLVWTFYLITLGSVYQKELYASLITLWVVNAMGIFRAWQAEIISRKEVFGESKRLTEESTVANIGKREEQLVRAFMPGFLQSSTPGHTQTFENASFALVRFEFLDNLLLSDDSVLTKRQRLSGIMLIVDTVCKKWDIRRILTHGNVMSFVANIPTTRCTGHAAMFCAISEIVNGLFDLCGGVCLACVTAGPLSLTLAGNMCRSVLFKGPAYQQALGCLTNEMVIQMQDSTVFVSEAVQQDVLLAYRGNDLVFDNNFPMDCVPCIDHISVSNTIENYVQTRPQSTAWRQFSLVDDQVEDEGILMMDLESSDGDDTVSLGWSVRQRQSTTDISSFLVDRSHQLRRKTRFLKEIWQRLGYERTYRIVHSRGFVNASVDETCRVSFWDQYRRRHWPLMIFWFLVGLVILMAFAGLDAVIFPKETRDSNFVRLVGGPLIFLAFVCAFFWVRKAQTTMVYLLPLAWVYVVYITVFILYIVSPPEDTLYGGPRLFTVFAFAVFCRVPLPFFLIFLPCPLVTYWLARVLDSSGVDQDGRPLVDTSMELGFQIAAATIGAFIVSVLDWNDDERYFLKTREYARSQARRENKIEQLRDMIKYYLPRPLIEATTSSPTRSNEIVSISDRCVGVILFPPNLNIQELATACETLDNILAHSEEFEKICFSENEYYVRHVGMRHAISNFDLLIQNNTHNLPENCRSGIAEGQLFICALGVQATTIGVWGQAVTLALEEARIQPF